MSHACITVNGEVLMDGGLDQFIERPPEFVADIIKEGGKSADPYMLAVMLALGDAVTGHKNIVVDATTGPDWWTLTVKER